MVPDATQAPALEQDARNNPNRFRLPPLLPETLPPHVRRVPKLKVVPFDGSEYVYEK